MVVTVQLPLERRDDGLLTRHTRRSLWLSGSVRRLDTTGLEAGSLWQCEGHSGRVQSRAVGLLFVNGSKHCAQLVLGSLAVNVFSGSRVPLA